MAKKNDRKAGKKKKHFWDRYDFFDEDDSFDEEDEDDEEDDEEDEEDDEDELEEEEDEEEESDEDDEEGDEDEYDEEDNEEEDDYEDNEEEDDYEDSVDYKRERRRKRRIRNQIVAYSSVAVLLILLFAGGFFFVKGLITGGKNKPVESGTEASESMPTLESEAIIAEPESVEPEVSPLDEIIYAKLAEMPLEDKVSALFMVTPDGLTGVNNVTKAGETTQNILNQYKVGGLLYSAGNIKDETQLKEMLTGTANIDQNIFLAVREEPGKFGVVSSKLNVEKTSEASILGDGADPEAARNAGVTIGTYLSGLGFNLALAPVADVRIEGGNEAMKERTFSTDYGVVGSMAAAFVEGVESTGVSTCVKTFPGLGGLTGSTADGMATTERTLEEMQANEYEAYKAALAGSNMLMVGTVSAPALTGDNTPCCLSSAGVDVVRSELAFDGIVITGPLNEKSITDYYTSGEAAVKALKAGADMVLMPEKFEEAYQAVLEAVQSGELEESRMEEALLRIYRVKYKDKV